MTSEIKQWTKTYEICQEYDNSQTKETLMSHGMSYRPSQKVGIDFFSYRENYFLVTTDYKSNFWEIDYLSSASSTPVITKLKVHFARMGIPGTVVSDHGPQFSSRDYAQFSKKCGLSIHRRHLTTVDRMAKLNHQSNRLRRLSGKPRSTEKISTLLC